MDLKNKIKNMALSQDKYEQGRYNCIACSDTKGRLYIIREDTLIKAYCHNAGCPLNKGLVFPYYNAPLNINKHRGQNLKKPALKFTKTLKFTKKLPTNFVDYLCKYLHLKTIYKYNQAGLIQYETNFNRVGFKCSPQGSWVLRGLNLNPKWLNFNAKWFGLVSRENKYKIIFLVEDAISSIKLFEVAGYTSVALLGTKLRQELLLKLLPKKTETKIIIWLDKDQAGILSSINLKNKLDSLGFTCYTIYQEEPKKLTRKEIKETIGGLNV